MRRKHQIDRQMLEALYARNDLSISEVAQRLGTPQWLLYERLKEFKIPKRSETTYINTTLSEGVRGYIAGIIDGEGCIYFSTENQNKLHARLDIANTNQKMIVAIHSLIGGGYWTKYERIELNQKTVYRMNVTRLADLMCLFSLIKEHMIIKKQQAELILEFGDLHLTHRGLRTPCSSREWQIFKEIKILNHRGTQPIDFNMKSPSAPSILG